MTFAQLLALDGRDLVWLLEVSTDKFATVTYRWATHAVNVGGNQYEARLLAVGNINRGFGVDHLPVASSTQLVIDNTDFGADFLVARATVETTVFKASFRLSIGLSDTVTNTYQSTLLTQQVGTFVCLDMPQRDNDGRVTLSLADDAMGQLNDLLPPPTPNDWLTAFNAGTETTGPFGNVTWPNSPQPLFDWNRPPLLQFGQGNQALGYPAYPLCTFRVSRTPVDFDTGFFGAGRRPYIYPILVLATRDSAAITGADVTALVGVYRKDVVDNEWLRGKSEQIPSTANLLGTALPIWKAYKTDTINITGPDGTVYPWKLLWVAFDVGAFATWRNQIQALPGGGTPSAQINNTANLAMAPEFAVHGFSTAGGPVPSIPTPAACNGIFAAFDFFVAAGGPGSQITNVSATSPWPVTGAASSAWIGSPQAILQDLVQYYSAAGATAIDTTRFTRAGKVPAVQVRGEISPDVARPAAGQVLAAAQSPFGVGNLRKAIAEICASADLDLFVTMSGQVAIISQGSDFETRTTVYPTIDEERMANVRERIPSPGERWAPYNRVYVQRQAPWLMDQSQNLLFGPFDEPGAISTWGRIITKVLPGKWWRQLQIAPNLFEQSNISWVWAARKLEAKVRGILEFTTDLGVLALELGDYFTTSWTRGGSNSAYASAMWRLETMTVRPGAGEVDVTAVWVGDLQTELPYLLDDEALIIRTTPAAGQTLTVTDGSTTITRSAGSFVTDGVAPGDIVRVRDSTEALTSFARNKDVRVVSITNALNLVVSDSVWSPAGAHVVADVDWSILRGATTYHTSSTDPANYPSGGTMYGKVTSAAGVFSDASTGNKLLDG